MAESNGLREMVYCVNPCRPVRCHHLVPVRAHISLDREEAGACTLNEMNVGGRVGLAPPAFPNFVIDVAVASVA
ncbi:hypothetical protein AAG906_024667 [Vitis piasezkii]